MGILGVPHAFCYASGAIYVTMYVLLPRRPLPGSDDRSLASRGSRRSFTEMFAATSRESEGDDDDEDGGGGDDDDGRRTTTRAVFPTSVPEKTTPRTLQEQQWEFSVCRARSATPLAPPLWRNTVCHLNVDMRFARWNARTRHQWSVVFSGCHRRQTLRCGIIPVLYWSARATPHSRNKAGKMPSRVQSQTFRDCIFPVLF